MAELDAQGQSDLQEQFQREQHATDTLVGLGDLERPPKDQELRLRDMVRAGVVVSVL